MKMNFALRPLAILTLVIVAAWMQPAWMQPAWMQPASAQAASMPLVAVGAAPNTLYVAPPDTSMVDLIRRDGTVLVSRSFASPPTGLALDARRGLLYVAVQGSDRIMVLSGRSLRLVRSFSAVAAAVDLAPLPGRDALYLFDPATRQRRLFLYGAHQARRTAPAAKPASPPASPALHISIGNAMGGPARAAYWATGFGPGETVAVSWGARSLGAVQADAYGIVGGSVPITAAQPFVQSLSLVGLSGGRILTQVVDTRPRPQHRAGRRPLPPLILAIVPGPTTTLTAPAGVGRIRVPVAASAAAILPLAAVTLIVRARRKKAAAAAAAKAAKSTRKRR